MDEKPKPLKVDKPEYDVIEDGVPAWVGVLGVLSLFACWVALFLIIWICNH